MGVRGVPGPTRGAADDWSDVVPPSCSRHQPTQPEYYVLTAAVLLGKLWPTNGTQASQPAPHAYEVNRLVFLRGGGLWRRRTATPSAPIFTISTFSDKLKTMIQMDEM